MMTKNRSTTSQIADTLNSMVSMNPHKNGQSNFMKWYRKLQYLGAAVSLIGISLITISWFTELRHVRGLAFIDPNFLITTGLGLIFLFNVLFNYICCAIADPGIYPKQTNDPNWLNQYPSETKPLCCDKSPPNPANWTPCYRCEHWRPPHTHHCSTCKNCVVDLDHHCPWVANCVGRNNIREYILFLFWMSIGIPYYLFFCFHAVGTWKLFMTIGKIARFLSPGGGLAILFAVHQSGGDPSKMGNTGMMGFTHEEYEQMFLLFTVVISLAGWLFVVFLEIQQFKNMRDGQSSVEFFQNVTLKNHLKKFHSQNWTHENKGFKANFLQAMRLSENSSMLSMIFPLSVSLPARRDGSKAF